MLALNPPPPNLIPNTVRVQTCSLMEAEVNLRKTRCYFETEGKLTELRCLFQIGATLPKSRVVFACCPSDNQSHSLLISSLYKHSQKKLAQRKEIITQRYTFENLRSHHNPLIYTASKPPLPGNHHKNNKQTDTDAAQFTFYQHV